MAMSPDPGTKVEKGSTITISVSKGEKEKNTENILQFSYGSFISLPRYIGNLRHSCAI